ncbi:hypothetical protein DPMN_160436 [Dreissena polymorpha]|uniref:Uncharacterized protein n=1 Tax=Dreissena polymorpha TaxID=45954 RepID=A0A9D4EN58_DREPO|nr:hypothetical protein DPMN_160436 [Dreissena polymorpha]
MTKDNTGNTATCGLLLRLRVYCFNETLQARERRSVPTTLTGSVILTVSGEGENNLSPSDAIMMQKHIY